MESTARDGLGLSADPLRLTMVLLLVFAVSRIHEQFSPLVILRQLLLVGLLIAFVMFGESAQLRPRRLFSAWPARVIAGLGIMACISIPFGLSIGASGKFVLLGYSKVLLLAFLVIACIRSVRDLHTMVTGVVLGSAMLMLLALFVFRSGTMGSLGLSRIVGGSGDYSFDANDMGTVATVGIGVSLLLVAGSTGLLRVLGGITALGLVAAIARTGSRGGFLGVLGLGLGFVVLARGFPLWKRVGLLAVAAGGLFLTAPTKYWLQMKTIFNPQEDYNWTAPEGRIPVWKRGMKYMWSHPLTGVGVSNFSRAEGTISDRAIDFMAGQPGIKWSAPHNSFLEAGAEMGLPGLALFSTMVLGGIGGMVRLRRRFPAGWKNGSDRERFMYHAPSYLALAMFGFAVAGFFVSFAYLDLVYLLAALTSGTYMCAREMLGSGTTPPRVPGRRSPAPV